MIKTKSILAILLCLTATFSIANNNKYTGAFVSVSPYAFPTITHNIDDNTNSFSRDGRPDSIPYTFKAGYKFKHVRIFGAHTTNISTDIISGVDFSFIVLDYVSDGGFIIGLGTGTGAYRSKNSVFPINNSGNTATHFNIGYGELTKGFQWSVMYSISNFTFTHQIFPREIIAPLNVNIRFVGVALEFGYGF